MVKVEIVNIVSTASLAEDVDLKALRNAKEISYNSKIYGGKVAYFKTEKMQGRVSIFNSGKMISVGTKSETQAFKELELAMHFLIKKRFAKQVSIPELPVPGTAKNLVLEELSEQINMIYEPDQFPGAILRFEKPFKSTILLFASGKAVVAGLKSSEQISPTIQKLNQFIESQ